MEALLAKIQALSDERVWPAASGILNAVKQNPQTASIVRSFLVALVAVAGDPSQAACDNVLQEIDAQPLFDIEGQVFSQPWLRAAKKWCSLVNSSFFQEGMHVLVPVAMLRFTHDTISSRLQFKNQASIFKSFDDLQRRPINFSTMSPDFEEPLDICVVDGSIYSLSNRRLFVLLMYQIVHRDLDVRAACIVRDVAWKQGKFRRSCTTKNNGLGVILGNNRHDEAFHYGRTLFDAGKSALSMLTELLEHSNFEWLLDCLELTVPSPRQGYHSLKLKQEAVQSGTQLGRMSSDVGSFKCVCDYCDAALSLRNWYHKPGTDNDLCRQHWSELTEKSKQQYKRIDDFSGLGDDRCEYVRNLDYLPELDDDIWATWHNKASFFKDRGTVTSFSWKGCAPQIMIRWFRPLQETPCTSHLSWNGFWWLRDESAETEQQPIIRISKAAPVLNDLKILSPIPAAFDGDSFMTVGIPSCMKADGKYYYEVKLGENVQQTQVGWLTSCFKPTEHSGVGDDTNGWAADGIGMCNWICGKSLDVSWPRAWVASDIIGCAIDFGGQIMQFSHNGVWLSEASISFRKLGSREKVFPAVSISGEFEILVKRSSWLFAPPHIKPEAKKSSYKYKAWSYEIASYCRPSCDSDVSSETESEEEDEEEDTSSTDDEILTQAAPIVISSDSETSSES